MDPANWYLWYFYYRQQNDFWAQINSNPLYLAAIWGVALVIILVAVLYLAKNYTPWVVFMFVAYGEFCGYSYLYFSQPLTFIPWFLMPFFPFAVMGDVTGKVIEISFQASLEQSIAQGITFFPNWIVQSQFPSQVVFFNFTALLVMFGFELWRTRKLLRTIIIFYGLGLGLFGYVQAIIYTLIIYGRMSFSDYLWWNATIQTYWFWIFIAVLGTITFLYWYLKYYRRKTKLKAGIVEVGV